VLKSGKTGMNLIIFPSAFLQQKACNINALQALGLAEEVGFEPTCPCGQLHFESQTRTGIQRNLEEPCGSQRKHKSLCFQGLPVSSKGGKPANTLVPMSSRFIAFFSVLGEKNGFRREFGENLKPFKHDYLSG
jgi:hypothetical protein